MSESTRESIIDVSRDFFNEIVKPILEREFPKETARTAFGVFGLGSDALGLDDEYSQDHHWGLRINALMPDELLATHGEEIQRVVSKNLPSTYRGKNLREGHEGGKALALDGLQTFFSRALGIDHLPETYREWLELPEEEIIHFINGEVWHDPAGDFTAIRKTFSNYYPEPVRLRRIAHWCRYCSGMGTYWLKRAILRDDEFFAATSFGKAVRLSVQLAFLLDRQYFPYDKWLMIFFKRLPRLADPLVPLVSEAVSLSCPWERKLELLDQVAEILDATMVADGIIKKHPKLIGSSSSGCRLLEHAYAELIKASPAEIKTVVPVWDQVYLEEFHSGYVNSLDTNTWHGLLNLTPESP